MFIETLRSWCKDYWKNDDKQMMDISLQEVEKELIFLASRGQTSCNFSYLFKFAPELRREEMAQKVMEILQAEPYGLKIKIKKGKDRWGIDWENSIVSWE